MFVVAFLTSLVCRLVVAYCICLCVGLLCLCLIGALGAFVCFLQLLFDCGVFDWWYACL